MNIRYFKFVLLISIVLVAGCRLPAPQPTPSFQATSVPVASPTPPTETPPAPPLDVSTGVTPTPLPPALWPTILTEIEIDLAYDPWLYTRPLAVDPGGDWLYVSGDPDQTLVLSASDLFVEGKLDSGGNLALDSVYDRLYIGNLDGLAVYGRMSRRLLREVELPQPAEGDVAPPVPAVPLADVSSGVVYAIQNGLYRISAGGLSEAEPLGEPRDVRAIALDEKQGVLYANINNGIPGSNNQNDLWAVDLITDQLRLVTPTDQLRLVTPNVRDFVVDPVQDQLIVALDTRPSVPGALQVWQVSPTVRPPAHPLTVTHSLYNISGQLAVDGERDRLYVLSDDQSNRLMVLQASSLALTADVALPGPYAAMALNAQADRLYLLSNDGRLLVMSGHGGKTPRAQSFQPVQTPTSPVARLIFSPDFSRGKTIFGIWGSNVQRGGTLLSSKDGGATWGTVGGGLPASPGVTDLAFSPDFARDRTLFAATRRGLYRSRDGGETWEPASAGLNDLWIIQLALSPAYAREPILYALTYHGGLHRSRDGGQTWLSLAYRYANSPDEQEVYALALSPNFERDRALLLAADRRRGRLLVSRSAGDSWKLAANTTALELHFSPGFAQDHTVFGTFDQEGLMRSTDGGQTWSGALRGIQRASGKASLALSSTFDQDQTALLLMGSPAQLYRTTDGGESWQISLEVETSHRLTQTISLAAFSPSDQPANQHAVWLGLANGQVLALNIDDLAWSPVRATLPTHLEAVVLSPDFEQDSTLFVASREAGVWASTDGSETWADSGFPARELGIGRMHLAISPDFGRDRTVFAATGSQLYRSTDGGQSWQILALVPGNLFPINALAVSPNYANDHTLMVAGDYRAPNVLRSTDGGNTWQSDATGLPATVNLNMLAFSPNFAADRGVYVWAESEGLYRSGDGGQTWGRVYQPAGSWLIQSFALSPGFGRDRLMFLGTLKENHNVYRSADGGASWHPAELGLPLELIWASALALSPDFEHDREIFLGTDQGIYHSSNGGQMWRLVVNLPEIVALAISPGADGRHTIFAISARNGLYLSSDGGERWQLVNQ